MLTDGERYARHYRELIGLETSRRTLTPSAGLILGGRRYIHLLGAASGMIDFAHSVPSAIMASP
jgi:hypothetical protein